MMHELAHELRPVTGMSTYTPHHDKTCLNNINKNTHTFLIDEIGHFSVNICQVDRQTVPVDLFLRLKHAHAPDQV